MRPDDGEVLDDVLRAVMAALAVLVLVVGGVLLLVLQECPA